MTSLVFGRAARTSCWVIGPVPAPSALSHRALAQSMPRTIDRARNRDDGENDAIARPWETNLRSISHQSGPWGGRGDSFFGLPVRLGIIRGLDSVYSVIASRSSAEHSDSAKSGNVPQVD